MCKPEPATHTKKDKHQNVVTMVTYWVVKIQTFLFAYLCLLYFTQFTLQDSGIKEKYLKNIYVQKSSEQTN